MFFLVVFCFLLLFIFGLVTVFERNFLGLSQMRLGPGKSMFFGYFQMLFDGFKLFFSESFIILKSDDFYFFLTSVLRFILIVLVYFFLPFFFDFSSWN